MHNNPEQWQEPEKFIPERYDPESEYFTIPGSQCTRDPLSYLPFSTGPRGCPGMQFALTEIKTLVAFFICRVEYSIPKELLEDPYIHFGLESDEYELEIKIDKISI